MLKQSLDLLGVKRAEPPLQLNQPSLHKQQNVVGDHFLDPKGGSQKATLVVVVVVVLFVVVISSLKIHKAFLIRSKAQRNFAHAFVLTLPTDLPSQIFS